MDAPDPDPTPAEAAADAATDGTDVDQLRAERDELAAQVQQLSSGPPPKHRLRKVTAVFLVAVFALTFVASGVGIWLHRNTLNDDVWNERVVPLGKDPDVQKALAAWTTRELMKTVNPKALFQEALPDGRAQILAVPLTSALEGFVSDKVDEFYASDRFEELWTAAATQAHDAAIRTLRGQTPAVVADGDKITINLIPLINAVLAEILDAAPGLVGSDVKLPKITVDDVPLVARQKLAKALGVKNLGDDFGTFTVYDGGKLSAAQQAVKIFDKVVPLATLLALFSFAGALAVSTRRRRTLLQLLGVAAVACIAIRRICFMLQDDVTTLVKIEVNRPAVETIVGTFVNPLTASAATVLWVIAIAAAITILTGPYGWVRRLRSSIAGLFGAATTAVGNRANDDATLAWVVEHVDGLRIAGYALGALLLWFVDLTWVSFFLIALVVAAWQVVVARLAVRGTERAEGGDGEGGSDDVDPAAPATPDPATA